MKVYEFQSEQQKAIQAMPSSQLIKLPASLYANKVCIGDLVRFVDGVFAEVHNISVHNGFTSIHFNNGRVAIVKHHAGVLRAVALNHNCGGKWSIVKKSNWAYGRFNFFMVLTHRDKWRIK